MQVPVSVPPHCKVTQLRIEAETEQAFDRAADQFDATEKILTVGPLMNGETSAYSFRYVKIENEGVTVEIQGPRRQHVVTIVDGDA